MLREYIQKIQRKENLTPFEVSYAMERVISGEATHDDIRDFLVALNEKGPTIDEITAAARIMRKFVLSVKTRHEIVLDTCGTGGDNSNTFNISTLTALVVAAAGIVVAKHGNRSVSSRCGSADVLEALGVNLDVEEKFLGECLDEVGIAFLFAQKLHPAMKNVAPARKALGVKTIFNILGPLTNPANANYQMMGVYSRDLLEPLAHVLKNLGLKRAVVVHGSDGLDEITTTGQSYICEFDGENVISYDVSPEEVGLKRARAQDLKGGDLKENIVIAQDVLNGAHGAHRDIVTLNAAYALYAVMAVNNVAEGIVISRHIFDSGRAKQKLEELRDFTNRF